MPPLYCRLAPAPAPTTRTTTAAAVAMSDDGGPGPGKRKFSVGSSVKPEDDDDGSDKKRGKFAIKFLEDKSEFLGCFFGGVGEVKIGNLNLQPRSRRRRHPTRGARATPLHRPWQGGSSTLN